jgi:pimeloyl-ACP methyl ester carboxylesterase
VRLHVEEHGDGPPLLLLNGLGYANWAWQRQLPELSRRFHCIAVENRGTGRSPQPPGPYSLEEMADDAAEMLDGRRAHVCGYSMGGYLAQALALRHPQLVDRLVLVCSGTGGPNVVPTPKETTAVWLANAEKSPQEFARATQHLSFRPGWADEHPDELQELLRTRLEYPTPPECWRAQYDAASAWNTRVHPLETVESPVLVVHGTADRIVPYENGVELARRFMRARLETFEGAGHLLFIEEPERFNGLVEEFLA